MRRKLLLCGVVIATFSAQLDAQPAPGEIGVYLARLQSARQTSSRRLVLLK